MYIYIYIERERDTYLQTPISWDPPYVGLYRYMYIHIHTYIHTYTHNFIYTYICICHIIILSFLRHSFIIGGRRPCCSPR